MKTPSEEHPTQKPTLQDRKHLVLLAIIVFGLFSVLIAQFFNIQIIEGAKWTRVAQRQHFFIVKEPFIRGAFYSNTSIKKGHPETPQPFVIDIEKFHLYADPESIPDEYKDEIANKLLSMLDLSSDDQGQFRKQFDRKSRSRKLSMWLDRQTRDMVIEWWKPYASKHKIARNALFFVNDYQRSYPFGKLLGQVLHTIQNTKDELTHQAVPTGGLELYFNKYLKGKQGKRQLMRSPRNSFETGNLLEAPQNGADIYLTVNHVLQAICEEELAKGVKKAKAKAGWAVMMDPKNGEILALAQYPFFYPPEYQFYFNDPEMIENTKVKAITDANEPGSIMKPITLAVALKANEELAKRGEKPLFDVEEKIGTFNGQFPGRRKPISDTHFHSYLNMNMGLQKSSNRYMGRLVERIINRLGAGWYRSVLQDQFSLGKKTHLELPGESRGVLSTPGRKHPNGTDEWSTSTPFSMAMGHNIQVTSIQLLMAYAVFANGGYTVSPTLVRKIVKNHEDGKQEVLLDNTTPERIASFPKAVDNSETIRLVVNAMKYTTKPGGTARRADVPGYTEAGKTGTPEKIVNGKYTDRKHCPSFIGFTPVIDPAFVLIVTLDEPEAGYVPGVGKSHMGGTCCAPIFAEISKRSLEYLGVAPDDPFGYPVGDPRYNADKADWMKETRLLKEMYEKWNNKSSSASGVQR